MLENPLENYFKLTLRQKNILHKLGLKTVKDLLWHFPSRYEGFAGRKAIADLLANERASIHARVIKIEAKKLFRKKINIAIATVSDGTGSLQITWFNQAYLANKLKPDTDYTFTGTVKRGKYGIGMQNPIFESGEIEIPQDSGTLVPIYPETRGLTSRWLRFALNRVWNNIPEENFDDHIPENILKKYNLPSLKTALREIHFPRGVKWAEAARKRFSFEEIFLIQLMRQSWRKSRDLHPSFSIKIPQTELDAFIKKLPFELTAAQKKAIEHIFENFDPKKGPAKPMSRLLEGDVGSGKTIVAMIASLVAINNGYQVAYMAPTEVLARQIFNEFIKFFGGIYPHTKNFGVGVKMGMATSSEFLKFPSKAFAGQATHIARAPLLRWLASGEIQLLIGTHALIAEKIKFKDLALVIIDEQHRFGINQRLKLIQKNGGSASWRIPHLLSMTATPIPRTLALTIYGDLDLTLLDEMPAGRKKIITEIVSPQKRNEAYEHIRAEIKSGRQAYVICPRIETPEENEASLLQLSMRAVKDEYKKLSAEIFPEFKVGMLHGQMNPKEKEKIMKEFHEGGINILVATSVIEVGINVPNATVIIIEGAERFGLAQLHQLRGRVMRSTHQPFCFLFTESNTAKTKERLQALVEAKSGFELAEYDLKFRGAGELTGSKQWGISDVGMEALKNIKMVEAAREEAKKIIESDTLHQYPELSRRITVQSQLIHFE
ncbi:ATP-dependent DNA helicase RecG [Candidatus Giovannonibacteria bacterium]|nr:ATP-dependent DNA helicase RecG [Candidatus Giovannonibacteria bacterium]